MLNRHRSLRSIRIGISVLGTTALSLMLAPSQAIAGHNQDCPGDLEHRTTEQTIEEHIALIQAGNIDEALCDYAPDAAVILPGQVVTGLDNIRAGLEGIGSLLGGAIPEVTSLTTHDSTGLLTFSAFGTPCTIPDGSDTYIVKKGRIVTQTVHDTFESAPGFVCPVAAPML